MNTIKHYNNRLFLIYTFRTLLPVFRGIIILILFFGGREKLFGQQASIPGASKARTEMLAQKNFTFGKENYTITVSRTDQGMFLYTVRRNSVSAVKQVKKQEEQKKKIKEALTDAEKQIKIIQHTKDSLWNTARDTAAGADTTFMWHTMNKLQQQQYLQDSLSGVIVQLADSLAEAQLVATPGIQQAEFGSLSADLLVDFTCDAINQLSSDTSNCLAWDHTYLSHVISPLIREATIEQDRDSLHAAGQLCVMQDVRIYPGLASSYSKISTSPFVKRKGLLRKARLQTEVIRKLKQNADTSDPQVKKAFDWLHKNNSLYQIIYTKNIPEHTTRVILEYVANTIPTGSRRRVNKNMRQSPDNSTKRITGIKKWFSCNINKESKAPFDIFFNKKRRRKLQTMCLSITRADTLIITYIEGQIQESSLQKVEIMGHLKSDTTVKLVFDGRNIPYPFSSQIYMKGYKRYIPLRSRYITSNGQGLVPNAVYYDMNLWDAIQYTPRFYPGSDNLAPHDTAFSLACDSLAGNCLTLYKGRISRLFEVKVYSDPLGFESDVPNGLIQFELTKRFTTVARSTKLNGFTFVEPRFIWSKIEDKGNLAISFKEDTSGTYETELTPVDLYRYAKLHLEFRINGATLAIPAASMNLYLNAGIGAFQTSIEDTLLDELTLKDSLGQDSVTTTSIKDIRSENINSLNAFIDLDLKFQPEGRYSLLLNTRFGHFTPLNEQYSFRDDMSYRTRLFNYYSISLEGSVTVNNTRYYGRGIFTSNLKTPENNFFQLQIGVAKSLFKSNEGK